MRTYAKFGLLTFVILGIGWLHGGMAHAATVNVYGAGGRESSEHTSTSYPGYWGSNLTTDSPAETFVGSTSDSTNFNFTYGYIGGAGTSTPNNPYGWTSTTNTYSWGSGNDSLTVWGGTARGPINMLGGTNTITIEGGTNYFGDISMAGGAGNSGTITVKGGNGELGAGNAVTMGNININAATATVTAANAEGLSVTSVTLSGANASTIVDPNTDMTVTNDIVLSGTVSNTVSVGANGSLDVDGKIVMDGATNKIDAGVEAVIDVAGNVSMTGTTNTVQTATDSDIDIGGNLIMNGTTNTIDVVAGAAVDVVGEISMTGTNTITVAGTLNSGDSIQMSDDDGSTFTVNSGGSVTVGSDDTHFIDMAEGDNNVVTINDDLTIGGGDGKLTFGNGNNNQLIINESTSTTVDANIEMKGTGTNIFTANNGKVTGTVDIGNNAANNVTVNGTEFDKLVTIGNGDIDFKDAILTEGLVVSANANGHDLNLVDTTSVAVVEVESGAVGGKTTVDGGHLQAGLVIGDSSDYTVTIKGDATIDSGVKVGAATNNGLIKHNLSDGSSTINGGYSLGAGDHTFIDPNDPPAYTTIEATINGAFGKTPGTGSAGTVTGYVGGGQINGDVTLGWGNNKFGIKGNGSITGDITAFGGADELTFQGGTVTGNIDAGDGDNRLVFTNSTIIGTVTSGENDDTYIYNGGSQTGDINLGGGTNSLSFTGTTMVGNITDDGGAGNQNGNNTLSFSGGSFTGGKITFGDGNNNSTFKDGVFLQGNTAGTIVHEYGDGNNVFNFEDANYGALGDNVQFKVGTGENIYNLDGGGNREMRLDVTDAGGADSHWNLKSGAFQGTLTAEGGDSHFRHTGGTLTVDGNGDGGEVVIRGADVESDYYLTGTGRVANSGTIDVNITGDSIFRFLQDNGVMDGTLTSVDQDTQNFLTFEKNANYSGLSTIHGTDNQVWVKLDSTAADFTGIVDLSNSVSTTDGYNLVTIDSGRLTNADGAIHGSDTGKTVFDLNGGYVKQLYGGDGQSIFYVGKDVVVDNIKGDKQDTVDDKDKVAVTPDHNGTVIEEDGKHTMTTLLNQGYVQMEKNAELTIGEIDRTTSGLVSKRDAQITAHRVDVGETNKLYIHESNLNTGFDDYRTVENGLANVINVLNIEGGGVVNIDRTTIQGSQTLDGGATWVQTGGVINVGTGGMLHGWSEDDRVDTKPNLVGDLNLFTQGTIKPYDVSMWKDIAIGNREMSVHFVVDKAADGTGGNANWGSASILSTRMFAQGMEADTVWDNQKLTNLDVNLSHSDSVKAVNSEFKFNYNDSNLHNSAKVQYDPVFGHNYEWENKKLFERYEKDGDPEYYYKVVLNDEMVAALKDYNDANHLFNEDIVKSDMLGEWEFLKDPTDHNIYVRFRLLASNPRNGGLDDDLERPNSIAVGGVLDNIRYPFETDDNKHLGVFEKEDPATHWYLIDNGLDGFDGDIRKFYKQASEKFPGLYSNYKETWVDDMHDLFSGLQTYIINGGEVEYAVRQLHAESYASMVNVNLNMFRQLHGARENAYVSNLYQVENEQYERTMSKIEGNGEGLASVGFCGVEQFVCNPLRTWATGFGAKSKQKEHRTEYGYDSEIWGGAVGAIKEFGDLYVGATLGYGRDSSTFDELHAKAKTDAFLAEALIGVRCGMGFAEIFGNYSYNDHKMTRSIDISTYKRTARGEYHDNVYGGGVRLGYQLLTGNNWLILPTIGFTYLRSENSAFQETGNPGTFSLLKFKKGEIKRQSYQVPVMVRINRNFALGSCIFTPEVRAAFTPTFGNKVGKATAEFVGNVLPGQYFTSQGVDTGRYAAQIGGSLELSRRGRFFIRANYDFVYQKKSHDHQYSLNLGLNF